MTPQRKRQEMALLARAAACQVESFNSELVALRDAKRHVLARLAEHTCCLTQISAQLGLQGAPQPSPAKGAPVR